MKNLRHKLWVAKMNTRELSTSFLFLIKRKIFVILRKFSNHKYKNGYTFAILCIKKTNYIKMIIRQANSIHYFNPNHKFVIYTDNICSQELEKNKKGFDYPQRIEINNSFGVADLPWQIYKINMRIENSISGGIDIDADMVWHKDPEIDRDHLVMFAPAFLFKENKIQSEMILRLFKKPEWLEFTHFVSAFVSIPPQFMSKKLAEDARAYTKLILEDPLTFVENHSDREELRRVSEEIATCLALQSNYPKMTIGLKTNGDKKNKDLLEPIYFGSANRIIR